VIGLGQSGLAAAKVLADEGARVRVSERRPVEELGGSAEAAEQSGAEVFSGGHAPEHLDGAELVILSPGVAEGSEVVSWAATRGLPIWSELELGARLARCPYVAITGTNGKTTTTQLIAEAMRRSGMDAIACGNVGHPFSLAAAEGHDALAVEASSFQLRFHETFHPKVSALLNVAEDHTDWHGSPAAYVDAKRRIFLRQERDDVHVGNRDDARAAAVSREARCRVTWFTTGRPEVGQAGYRDEELIWREASGSRSLGRPFSEGPPHRANAAAAAAVAISFGVDVEAVASTVRETPPPPHRGEVVATVAGVDYVDDSKATNPHAAIATIRGFTEAILICGGRSKGVNLSPMGEAVPHVAGVVVLGEAAAELEAVFRGRVPVRDATSIEQAVQIASAMALPGRSVVLAPGCSSWDMFRDYAERGERFALAARALEQAGVSPG
jgi:UDP-N-acetylmuramoylalanine--D-glutamate ligase